MDPVIISPTIQEFGGVRYYLCGKYFQREGVRLHLAVWWHHRGIIPRGYHIHHIDGDRSNNRLDNLERLSARDHRSLHGPANGERIRKYQSLGQAAARAWHLSEEGRRWHEQHGQNMVGRPKSQRTPVICQECGSEYLVPAHSLGRAKFCGDTCGARFRRRQPSD